MFGNSLGGGILESRLGYLALLVLDGGFMGGGKRAVADVVDGKRELN